MELQIEKDVPIPDLRERGKWKILGELKPSESVFFPSDYVSNVTRTWRGSSDVRRKFPDRIYTGRSENGGVRVWRVT